MTFEKLLIFGFAIAAVSALVMASSNMTESRETSRDGYKDNVGDLVEMAK